MKRRGILISIFAVAMCLSGASAGCTKTDDDNNSSNSGTETTTTIVDVTSVTLDKSTLSLTVGSSGTLTAAVLPSNAADATVTWTTSSSSTATVSGGIVTAINVGSATITAAAGNKSATCTVTVTAASSSTGETIDCYSQTAGSEIVSGNTYTSSTSDANPVKVSGGTFTMTDCYVKKTGGDTSDSDKSSFYGINAGILSSGTGTVNMTGGSITTDAKGANAVVAYGGTVNITGVNINCSKNLSRGIHATGGGTIVAKNDTITTAGSNSSVIATDRGGGTVTVTGGIYRCSGNDSAVTYSTGTITVNNVTGSSSLGEVGVIEGSNSITINNCTMTSGDESRGMMILQSGSGDATGYDGKITVNDGSIKCTSSSAPLIEITTSTTGTVTLKDVTLTVPSGILMKVDYNTRWKTTSPVAYLVLSTASAAAYTGNVTVDSYGTATVTVNSGVTWTGAYDSSNSGKSTTAVINGTWTLSADSYVDKVTIASGGVIKRNGHTLNCSSITNNGALE